MKKLLAIAFVLLFSAAVLSPSVFANCGKDHSKTATEQPAPTAPTTTKA